MWKGERKKERQKVSIIPPLFIFCLCSMSNITGGEAGSFSSGNTGGEEVQQQDEQLNHYDPNNGSATQQQQQAPPAKKKRNLPGTPG